MRHAACDLRSPIRPVRGDLRGQPPHEHRALPDRGDGDSVKVIPLAADVTLTWTSSVESLPPDWEGSTRLFDLGMRPEAIAVSAADVSECVGVVPPKVIAQVRRLDFNGPELLATLALGPHRLVARLPAGQPIEDRQIVAVHFDLSRAVWFDQSTGEAFGPVVPGTRHARFIRKNRLLGRSSGK